MRIPAIRANIGEWRYYVSVMSFKDIKDFVKPINDELHKSNSLSELIQRSITENYKKIKEYLINQKDERFFNSLVLAVYAGDPKWVEVELDYKGDEFFNLGLLEFTGDEKIFPVDGQHRVEGIKAALSEDESLENEKVPVIFIGHKKDDEGMQRTRRLFSTLNRYAKPVSMSDIIALDEDDIIAIITRDLIESIELFKGERVSINQQKAISDSDKTAFTSIITLYQCNKELLKFFLDEKTERKVNDYLRVRPSKDEIERYKELVFTFWNNFSGNLKVIQEYNRNNSNVPASDFRNDNGGNILFRPVGLLPFVMAVIEIHKRTKQSFGDIISMYNDINMNLSDVPWKRVLWNELDKTMIMEDKQKIKLMLIFLYQKGLLSSTEFKKLSTFYADKISFQGVIEHALDGINTLYQ